jgi:homoserine kinase type II
MDRRPVNTSDLARTLVDSYGISPVEIVPIHAGTDTLNYRVTGSPGCVWFAKVYRDFADDRAALELAGFARAGGVPVPGVRSTVGGECITSGSIRMSLWEYVLDAETAVGGLRGRRWESVGATVGIMHRRLAEHPLTKPYRQPGQECFDVERATANYERLISAYEKRSTTDPFEEWALEALRERRSVLPLVAEVIRALPDLTMQVLHGDLAAPNVLLRGDAVAAVIDFQPPAARPLAWEIARIGCDPRTVVEEPDWPAGLARLAAAYRQENPAPAADLRSMVACGAAYTLLSAYPLAQPLKGPIDASLQAYGQARHESALILLDRLADADEALR